jgi:hypothetical protein
MSALKMTRLSWVALLITLSASSVSRSESNGEIWAVKLFDTLEVDCGTVPAGLECPQTVTLTNRSTVAVRISHIPMSKPGLRNLRLDKKTLQPSEMTAFRFAFDTIRFRGLKETGIELQFDQPEFAEVRILVKGETRSDLVVESGRFDLGNVECGQTAIQTISLKYLGDADWRIKQIGCDEKSVGASFKEVRRQTNRDGKTEVECELTATLSPIAPAGKIDAKISVELNDAKSRSFDVIVTGEIQADMPDEGLGKLFGKREKDEAGQWRVLDQPRPTIVDADLKQFATFTQLESLSLAFCKKVTDDGLVHLKPLAQLKHLNLGACRLVTDAGLAHLAPSVPPSREQ